MNDEQDRMNPQERDERKMRIERMNRQVREADERLKKAERLTADDLAARVNYSV